MARHKKYYIRTRYKSCPAWDRLFTRLEMKCFGHIYEGMEYEDTGIVDVNIDWDNNRATAKRRINEWVMFKRVEPYSYNFLFKLLEFLMTIVSWIRRWLVSLMFIGLVICLIIGMIGEFDTMMPAILALLGGIGGAYGVSLILALLGLLVRKAFGIEKKLKKKLRENGYSTSLSE